MLDDIDREAAGECGRAWADLVSSMLQASPELKTLAVRTLLSEGPKIKAVSINAFSRFVNGIARDDPAAFSRFVSDVIRNVDAEELGKASAVMTNAILDQKWHLASWTFRLIRERVKKRLGI
jgi:hypothetical protein